MSMYMSLCTCLYAHVHVHVDPLLQGAALPDPPFLLVLPLILAENLVLSELVKYSYENHILKLLTIITHHI